MSATSKRSAPPSSTSEEYSSSDEEQEVAQPTPSLANPSSSKRTRADRDSDNSDSDEDEDEEPEATVEEPKSPVKESASKSKPDKKKLKASAPDQSPPNKPAGAGAAPIVRIWKPEDEINFLQALSEYRASKGEIPQEKDYGSFLATISGSIGFAVTEKQIGNKIRQMRYNYNQKLKKGPFAKLSKPHDKAVFEMCAKVFEGGSKAVKKKEVKREANAGVKMADVGDGGVADVGDGNASSHPYLRGLIEGLIQEQSLVGLSSVEAVIARTGESRAAKLDAKIKVFKVDALKLRAREERLKADLLNILTDEMADD